MNFIKINFANDFANNQQALVPNLHQDHNTHHLISLMNQKVHHRNQ